MVGYWTGLQNYDAYMIFSYKNMIEGQGSIIP